MVQIRHAKADDEIQRCLPVMRQLRPHLKEAAFVAQVRRLEAGGYRLAYLETDGRVGAVAGYRISESLFDGIFMHVDDLVTDGARRSRGLGLALLDWLVGQARGAGCQRLRLDSGVQRFGAHRFYLRNRMDILAHHFVLDLAERVD